MMVSIGVVGAGIRPTSASTTNPPSAPRGETPGTAGDALQLRILRRGDHVLFIGEVEHVEYRDGTPLLFSTGAYRALRAGLTEDVFFS
ncbi:hypothetical protein [Amycolatopsis pigmentata]|uniref:Uncharacterized protein n=1 Tax=Amycolatopsis pigmentata TaxID=450801 RepID=A0ABW5G0S9_9PSEU